MKTVLQVLSGEAEPPVLPPERPPFVWSPMPPSFGELEYNYTGSQLAQVSKITGRRTKCVTMAIILKSSRSVFSIFSGVLLVYPVYYATIVFM